MRVDGGTFICGGEIVEVQYLGGRFPVPFNPLAPELDI